MCALVSMLVGSLSELLVCGGDRLSLQELGEDRPHVQLRPLNPPKLDGLPWISQENLGFRHGPGEHTVAY